MAQTTQIVPKYSFPYVETHINDYTQIADNTTAASEDPTVKLVFAVVAGKGIDNVWVRKRSKSSAIKTFGDSNFKKFGQPLMQALNALDKNNSQVWMMRVMPENAAYSNSIVSAYYKADTADDVADPHNRKFRIKLTSRSASDISTKAALYEEAEKLDGEAITGSYTDAEGYVQAPIMAVSYSGRGTCGDLYSLRLSQATSFEKDYGIKMYNFEVLSSENSIVKDANYVGALVSSMKYGSESTTLIDDVLSDAEEGLAPVDIHVLEDSVSDVYEAYIAFVKSIHDDLITEYEEKLEEYNIPEGMLDGTVPVTEEYAEKVATIKSIEKLITDSEDSALPDADEFDIIYGRKVASTASLPFISFTKKLDDTVDTDAEGYDANMYSVSDIVDFSSAKGLILENGGNGYFDNPRTTYEDEVEKCYLNAFNGTYDKRILSPRRFNVSAFFDANYPFSVKKQIVDLAGARNDCRVYLDTGIIPSLSTSSLRKLISDYSIFDDDMISVDIHNYITKEYSTNKKAVVTIDYFLSAQYIDHVNNYGVQIPFCKDYTRLTGHVRDSLNPVIEEYDLDMKEQLNNNRLNYFECIDENVFERATQNTSQKTATDLLEESNSAILFNIKRTVEMDVQSELYNFADETSRNSFIEIERAKLSPIINNVVESLDISFATSEFEFNRSILHCYLKVTFRGLTKQAIVEIDLNKRRYTVANTTTEEEE